MCTLEGGSSGAPIFRLACTEDVLCTLRCSPFPPPYLPPSPFSDLNLTLVLRKIALLCSKGENPSQRHKHRKTSGFRPAIIIRNADMVGISYNTLVLNKTLTLLVFGRNIMLRSYYTFRGYSYISIKYFFHFFRFKCIRVTREEIVVIFY